MSVKPKLLYIAHQNPYPPIDGGKIGIYYPLIYLNNFFEIFFACPINPKQYKIQKENVENHFLNKNIKTLLYPHNTKQDIKFLLKNFIKESPFKWDKYYSKRFQDEINKLIVKENIEFLWASAPHMAKYAIKARKMFPKIKIFFREHNIEFKLVEQFKNFTKNPIYKIISGWQFNKSKKLETKYWHLFDKVFFISDLDFTIANELKPEIYRKLIVLYDGYDIVINKPLVPKNTGFIYPVNFEAVQNLVNFKWFVNDVWISNLKELKKRNINLYVTGNTESRVKKVLGFNNIKDLNIISMGFVEDINRTILSYKYVLSPTIFGSGLRLKVLNGMACGKPVFLTPLDLSTCKVFEDMKNVVCFNTKKDFLEKLLSLEEDKEMYLKISEMAIETIKTYFNWNKYAEKVYKIIMEVE